MLSATINKAQFMPCVML